MKKLSNKEKFKFYILYVISLFVLIFITISFIYILLYVTDKFILIPLESNNNSLNLIACNNSCNILYPKNNNAAFSTKFKGDVYRDYNCICREVICTDTYCRFEDLGILKKK